MEPNPASLVRLGHGIVLCLLERQFAAAGLAAVSKHPYAQAIVAAGRNRKIAVAGLEGVEETPARGLARALPHGEERLGY